MKNFTVCTGWDSRMWPALAVLTCVFFCNKMYARFTGAKEK